MAVAIAREGKKTIRPAPPRKERGQRNLYKDGKCEQEVNYGVFRRRYYTTIYQKNISRTKRSLAFKDVGVVIG